MVSVGRALLVGVGQNRYAIKKHAHPTFYALTQAQALAQKYEAALATAAGNLETARQQHEAALVAAAQNLTAAQQQKRELAAQVEDMERTLSLERDCLTQLKAQLDSAQALAGSASSAVAAGSASSAALANPEVWMRHACLCPRHVHTCD